MSYGKKDCAGVIKDPSELIFKTGAITYVSLT